ncbi:MAG: S-layer homology domain-containing protein [Candidatus Margulisbacteria bacterium]|nr:S-layer homology domain-containing protein [Candidatus Margulisiibacteriota bacterium]
MRKTLLFFIVFFLFASLAHAGIFIYEPKDKEILFDEVIKLRGVGKDLEVLKINNQEIDFEKNGNFMCGLVLKPGKNLVEVRALDTNKQHFVQNIRLLRLLKFPDMEGLFNGQKHWARSRVVYLATYGYIEGYPDGNFYPANPITRGELATWIARIKGFKLEALTEDVFFDVPKEHWRAPYIKAIVDAGLMSGYNEKTFGIDDPLSRRKAAAIAVQAEGLKVAEDVKTFFVDVPKEESGAAPIYVAGEKGLVRGIYEDIKIFDPDRALTRAEAAVLFSRFDRSIKTVQYLFDFNSGYSEKVYAGLNIAPKIIAFTAEPSTISVMEQSTVHLEVEIAPRRVFYPIATVKVDLSEIGGIADVELFDDGTRGDKAAGDNIYSLNLSLEPVSSHIKTLTATAIDGLGWESQRQTSLLILE